MKKVMEGVVFPEEEGGVTCRFRYRIAGSSEWSSWAEDTSYSFGSCNSWSLDFIRQGSVAHCGYKTV